MSNLEVANEIIRQMGGYGKLKAMVNARDLLGDDNSVIFRFSGTKKCNKVRVTLDFARDTYRMEFLKVRGVDFKVVAEYEDVYNDQLVDIFEHVTGLFLTLFPRQ